MSQPYLAFHHDKEFKPPKSDTEPHLTQALAARRRRRRVVGEPMKSTSNTLYRCIARTEFHRSGKGCHAAARGNEEPYEPTFDSPAPAINFINASFLPPSWECPRSEARPANPLLCKASSRRTSCARPRVIGEDRLWLGPSPGQWEAMDGPLESL